jgi:cell division septation protein DedD
MSGFFPTRRSAFLLTALIGLTACADGEMPGFLQPKDSSAEQTTAAPRPGRTTERDIEAPEVFQTSEAGLWDGRPSLGGVWVAHPDVSEPDRAIIRNESNGKFVIGALFRREREAPGPRLQISSDAAAALGVLAGQPSNLNVVALRREEVPVEAPADAQAETPAVPAATEVDAQPLDPVVAGAAAALDAAPTPKPAAAPAPKPSSSLAKPFVQIGIFSVEQNAQNTAAAMRQAGMVPTVKKQSSAGKTFWRVLVGPAQSKSELATLLKTIKGTGFEDAYAVTH